jgi:perosamine synthetase
VRYCGAWPVFMDAEPDYWQMDPDKCARFLEQECQWRDGRLYNKTSGRPVTAIVPVDVLGHPCNYDAIQELAQRYGLVTIEDATESLGAKFNGKMVGRFGDVACFSFNGNKTITTGGGGMIVTDNQQWAERAQYLTTQAKDDPIEYVHNEIGYNYRLTNILAALGVAQMERLEEYIEKKRATALRYREALADLEGISLMESQPQADPTYWLYTILMPPGTSLEDRKQTIQELNDRGIGSRPLWHPIHALPPYRECQSFEIEHATDLYQRAVSIPSSVGLTDADIERSIDVIRRVILGLKAID